MSLQKLRDLIANDGYAITFQSMAAYRNALLAAFPVAHPAAPPAHKPSCASLNLLLLSSPPKPAPCDCGAAAPGNGQAAFEGSADGAEAAREYLVRCLRAAVGNDTFAQYIRDELAADFALVIANAHAAALVMEPTTIPEPTDDVLCACGWETWNTLGSYVDRGTATARYRTIAAFVLEGISSPQPLAQPDASQTRGAQ